jgi:hypothetical protein
LILEGTDGLGAILQGKYPQVCTDRKLGAPYIQSGRFGEEETIFPRLVSKFDIDVVVQIGDR